MSKSTHYKLRLMFPNSTLCADIWVEGFEYKDMLKTLRADTQPTQYWLRCTNGMFYNMAHVQSFIEIEQKTE